MARTDWLAGLRDDLPEPDPTFWDGADDGEEDEAPQPAVTAPDENRPHLADLAGLVPDLTGGLDVGEWLDRQHCGHGEELDRLRERVAELESEVRVLTTTEDGQLVLADAERDRQAARVDELERQRDAVLALCDSTRVGGSVNLCRCVSALDGDDHEPGCLGFRTVAWDLNPDDIRAVFGGGQ